MAISNNTLLNTHFQNENSFLIPECDRSKLVEVCDLLKLFICFSGNSKKLYLDSSSFSDVIDALYSLNSNELDSLMNNIPDSLKDLITSTELYLSHKNELTLDIKKHIIRFVLISSIHVGGAIIYMPLPRKRYTASEFIKLLSDLALSQKELSVEDISSINQQKNCLNQVKWPVYLLSIIKAIQIELNKMNLTYDLKFTIIESYLKSFVEFFAGRGRHFPSGLCILLSLRNQMICDEFNGRNINELAWKFGVSTATVYKYIRQLRAKNKKCF